MNQPIKIYLGIACELITRITSATEWLIPAQMFGVENHVKQGRLLRSQSFGDPDYPSNVLDLFNSILTDKGEETAKSFVDYVLSTELPYLTEEERNKHAHLINALEMNSSSIPTFLPTATSNFINISEFPDQFYRDLYDEINKAYRYGLFSTVPFLIRKFIENLVIDILRKKYTTRCIDLFYDTRNHKCHSFSTVVANLESKLSDFQSIERSLDSNFIALINKYRETGNATAHSISIKFGTNEIDKLTNSAEEIEYILKLLIRVNNLIV